MAAMLCSHSKPLRGVIQISAKLEDFTHKQARNTGSESLSSPRVQHSRMDGALERYCVPRNPDDLARVLILRNLCPKAPFN